MYINLLIRQKGVEAEITAKFGKYGSVKKIVDLFTWYPRILTMLLTMLLNFEGFQI